MCQSSSAGDITVHIPYLWEGCHSTINISILCYLKNCLKIAAAFQKHQISCILSDCFGLTVMLSWKGNSSVTSSVNQIFSNISLHFYQFRGTRLLIDANYFAHFPDSSLPTPFIPSYTLHPFLHPLSLPTPLLYPIHALYYSRPAPWCPSCNFSLSINVIQYL